MNKIGILQGRLTASDGRGTQFFPEENWRQEFTIGKDIGFQCIEWLVKKDDPRNNPLWNDKEREEIKELIKTSGVSIPSVHGFYSKDESYKKIAEELVELTADIGAKTVLISFFHDNILHTDDDKKVAIGQLEKALKKAEGLGIHLGIEAEIPATEIARFIELFQSEAVGSYYDIGNMVSMDVDVVKEIKLLGKKIIGIHIKDRTKGGGKSVPFGEGDSDFPAIFRALKDTGYSGAYIFQGARQDGIDDVALNTRYYEYIKKILQTL